MDLAEEFFKIPHPVCSGKLHIRSGISSEMYDEKLFNRLNFILDQEFIKNSLYRSH